MTRFQLILPVAYHNVTKKLTGCTERVPIYTKLTIRPIAFRICVTCYRQKLTVWPGKSISCKKTPQNWLFWWTQIWITLLWKALDTKWLTRTQTRSTTLGGMTVQTSYVGGQWHQNWADTSPQHFFLSWHGNLRKVIFLVKCSVPENFQRANFLRPVPTESLCTQDSENIVGLGDWASVSSGSKWDWLCYEKSRGVANQSHSANFGPIAWKQIEPGVPISESMFYSFQNDRTKNWRSVFF